MVYAIRQETDPLDPNCPNGCAQVKEFPGGGRSISYCQQCNEYSNKQFEISQAEKRERALLPDPKTREDVILRAEIANAGYVQYIGKWRTPEWKLGRIVRDVTTKMGVAFKRGDITIFREDRDGGYAFVSAYSWRNEIQTSIHAIDIGEVGD